MRFYTVDRFDRPTSQSKDGAYLQRDSWNDYGFTTLWTLYVVSGDIVSEIGGVKIGNRDDDSQPRPPVRFTELPSGFFSLGQDEDYYSALDRLGGAIRERILRALNDLAFDLDLFQDVQDLEVTQKSLLRWVTPLAVQTQLHRMARGGVRLSPFSFWYETPRRDRFDREIEPCRIDFDVNPLSTPRTNVHVLIGRNGVGKSYILNDITTALTRGESSGRLHFTKQADDRLTARFANVVSVAFSAFDSFERRRKSAAVDALQYHYVGLRNIPKSPNETASGLKDHTTLARDFSRSLGSCEERNRLDRWKAVLGVLAGDPMFSELLVRFEALEGESLRAEARAAFSELSSGHKIVLLTLTRLVETVEEATLVLIDEPESHLHPPLLSAFMDALSELLEERNGVALVATHSPVVLQGVPRTCVWKLMGSGGPRAVARPEMETYGENVGTLSQEVFGLEVAASGFHRSLSDAVREHPQANYSDLLEMFGGQLGAEARGLLQSMLHFGRS